MMETTWDAPEMSFHTLSAADISTSPTLVCLDKYI